MCFNLTNTWRKIYAIRGGTSKVIATQLFVADRHTDRARNSVFAMSLYMTVTSLRSKQTKPSELRKVAMKDE